MKHVTTPIIKEAMNVIMNMAAKIVAQTRSLLLSTRTERKLDAEPIFY